MAELATIARPYAEALFKASPARPARRRPQWLDALAAVAGNPQLQQFADNPQGHAPSRCSTWSPASHGVAAAAGRAATSCAP